MSSLLIATDKESIYTLSDPNVEKHAAEVITNKTPGISIARNQLAKMAVNEILVYLDDDIKLDPSVWERITRIGPHEVYMAEGHRHPITRVFAIRKEAFNEIGGFDENIRYNGEDLDFYWRALGQGYSITTIPRCLIHHKPHRKRNWAKSHFESAYTRIKHGRMSLDFFVQTNPVIAFLRLTGFIYHKILRGTRRTR